MKKSHRAGAIIVNSENNIVLVKEHLWTFPKGGVEEGEDYLEAAKREVYEETGLKEFHDEEYLDSFERYPHGITEDSPGAYPMVTHMYIFTTYEKDLNPMDDNVKDIGWYSYEDALRRMDNRIDREFLENNWEKVLEFAKKSF